MSREYIEQTEKISNELQAIIDAIPAYVYVKDSGSRFLRCNRAFAQYLGVDVKDMPKKSAFDLLPENIAEQHGYYDREVMSSGESTLGIEESVQREDGTRWFSTDRVPFRDETGEIVGVVCISMDITTQKEAETSLAESEERLRGFYDAAIEGIVVIEDGMMIDVNRRFTEIIGYDQDELIGMEAVTLVHDDDVSLVTERIKEGYESAYEVRVIRRDGSVLFVEAQGRIMQHRGRPVRVTTINDVTGRKILQAQLLHSQKMESIGTLAGGIAHDFNNLLTPIMASVGYMQIQLPQESPLHEDLQEITQAAERARGLVKRILAFSRREEARRQPVSLPALVREAVKLLRASIPSTIDIREQINDACCRVLADAGQLHQVIMNICTNAHQSMANRGGVLTIDLDSLSLNGSGKEGNPGLPEGAYAVITVSDTGCGMDAGTRDRIFEPYFTTKGPGEGSGLGLAVVHGIITSHGGQVTVWSEPGRGTVFSVYLPALDRGEPPQAQSTAVIPRGRERILLVDDERAVVRSTKKILTNLGYRVASYESSLKALEKFRKDPEEFDLLLTDLTIPGMTGTELTKEVLRIRPDMPVIICTGFSRSLNQEKAKEFGARALLNKPFRIEKLAKAIRKALARPLSDA